MSIVYKIWPFVLFAIRYLAIVYVILMVRVES